ncbi:GNAT family N-acetyltransferase [Herbaspirillum sp. NPDC087042]|uniref:GNAT family N-acetyltransferase n=1 Tax=Herbaspirillum sp. NPDC087042 TaxID=3364004 RepID=UPI0038017BED
MRPPPVPEEAAALLRGPRILLRRWRDSDRPALAAINADPLAMQHFPGVMSAADSNALAARLEAHFAHHGFGPWALEIPGVVEFAGFVGLLNVAFETHFTPAVEIGWRLAPAVWGQGYATEAAQCALAYGFTLLGLPQIVSFTVPANLRSLAVMQKLGMHSDPGDDFQHPRLPAGHPLRLHRLYRLTRQEWLARQAASGKPGQAGE